MLALDDFVLTDRTQAFIPHANFIKVDFLSSDADARAAIAARCPPGCVVIAEKIETVEAFDIARREGHTYFQGFFFGQPVIQPGRGVPGHHLQSLQLLTALQNPNISGSEIEELVKPDIRLCYLILRTVNCAGFAVRTTVHSIRDALVLIGHETIRRWASLWVVAGLGDTGNPELIAMSAARGRCCELLDARVEPGQTSHGFLIGMCSLLDAILSMPMSEIVEHLSLADETRAALLGQDTPGRRRLDCVIAYERGDWSAVARHALHAGINPRILPAIHAEAWDWANQLQSFKAAS
jgi:EAL and modified HD-GYP domain-containing signal transduction protein